jgi:hypothetical protein
MKDINMHLGMVLTSGKVEGNQRVATVSGLSYNGLDDLQATALQGLLVDEGFAAKFDALMDELRPALVEAGFTLAAAATNEDGTPTYDEEQLNLTRETFRGRGQGKKDKEFVR